MDLDKRLYYIELLSTYDKLLSPTQSEILNDHLKYDLSLSEIAENRNISRAAADDAIKKGIKKLLLFEEQLRQVENKGKIKNILAKLRQKYGNIEEFDEIEEAL